MSREITALEQTQLFSWNLSKQVSNG